MPKKLITQGGLKKIKEELEYLRNIKRKEIAQRLEQCISFGDLSENSEYFEAKEAQAFLEGRIRELEDIIESAVIAPDKIQNGDLIAVTTDIEGLDVVHAGIAVKIKKSLHLLHASQRAGKVVISGETLYRYLAQRKSRQGIMVARIL